MISPEMLQESFQTKIANELSKSSDISFVYYPEIDRNYFDSYAALKESEKQGIKDYLSGIFIPSGVSARVDIDYDGQRKRMMFSFSHRFPLIFIGNNVSRTEQIRLILRESDVNRMYSYAGHNGKNNRATELTKSQYEQYLQDVRAQAVNVPVSAPNSKRPVVYLTASPLLPTSASGPSGPSVSGPSASSSPGAANASSSSRTSMRDAIIKREFDKIIDQINRQLSQSDFCCYVKVSSTFEPQEMLSSEELEHLQELVKKHVYPKDKKYISLEVHEKFDGVVYFVIFKDRFGAICEHTNADEDEVLDNLLRGNPSSVEMNICQGFLYGSESYVDLIELIDEFPVPKFERIKTEVPDVTTAARLLEKKMESDLKKNEWLCYCSVEYGPASNFDLGQIEECQKILQPNIYSNGPADNIIVLPGFDDNIGILFVILKDRFTALCKLSGINKQIDQSIQLAGIVSGTEVAQTIQVSAGYKHYHLISKVRDAILSLPKPFAPSSSSSSSNPNPNSSSSSSSSAPRNLAVRLFDRFKPQMTEEFGSYPLLCYVSASFKFKPTEDVDLAVAKQVEDLLQREFYPLYPGNISVVFKKNVTLGAGFWDFDVFINDRFSALCNLAKVTPSIELFKESLSSQKPTLLSKLLTQTSIGRPSSFVPPDMVQKVTDLISALPKPHIAALPSTPSSSKVEEVFHQLKLRMIFRFRSSPLSCYYETTFKFSFEKFDDLSIRQLEEMVQKEFYPSHPGNISIIFKKSDADPLLTKCFVVVNDRFNAICQLANIKPSLDFFDDSNISPVLKTLIQVSIGHTPLGLSPHLNQQLKDAISALPKPKLPVVLSNLPSAASSSSTQPMCPGDGSPVEDCVKGLREAAKEFVKLQCTDANIGDDKAVPIEDTFQDVNLEGDAGKMSRNCLRAFCEKVEEFRKSRSKEEEGHQVVMLAYHGTSMDGANKILNSKIKVGPRTLYGAGVYLTPLLNAASFFSNQANNSYDKHHHPERIKHGELIPRSHVNIVACAVLLNHKELTFHDAENHTPQPCHYLVDPEALLHIPLFSFRLWNHYAHKNNVNPPLPNEEYGDSRVFALPNKRRVSVNRSITTPFEGRIGGAKTRKQIWKPVDILYMGLDGKIVPTTVKLPPSKYAP
jgi:hypothetical protein